MSSAISYAVDALPLHPKHVPAVAEKGVPSPNPHLPPIPHRLPQNYTRSVERIVPDHPCVAVAAGHDGAKTHPCDDSEVACAFGTEEVEEQQAQVSVDSSADRPMPSKLAPSSSDEAAHDLFFYCLPLADPAP